MCVQWSLDNAGHGDAANAAKSLRNFHVPPCAILGLWSALGSRAFVCRHVTSTVCNASLFEATKSVDIRALEGIPIVRFRLTHEQHNKRRQPQPGREIRERSSQLDRTEHSKKAKNQSNRSPRNSLRSEVIQNKGITHSLATVQPQQKRYSAEQTSISANSTLNRCLPALAAHRRPHPQACGACCSCRPCSCSCSAAPQARCRQGWPHPRPRCPRQRPAGCAC